MRLGTNGAKRLVITTITALGLANASGIASAQGEAAECRTPLHTVVPIMATHLIPPYPTISQQLGEAGVTLLKVQVGPDGIPTSVATSQTSGSPRLDEAAEKYVKKFYRWQPPDAVCPDGVSTGVQINWHLNPVSGINPKILVVRATPDDFPPDAKAHGEEGIVQFSLWVDDNGTVLQTNMVQGSGYLDLDNKAVQMVTGYTFTPARINGKPTAALMGLNIAFLREGAGK